jgi:hypothetical protein
MSQELGSRNLGKAYTNSLDRLQNGSSYSALGFVYIWELSFGIMRSAFEMPLEANTDLPVVYKESRSRNVWRCCLEM